MAHERPAASAPPDQRPARQAPGHRGLVLLGAALVVIGIAWLMDSTGLVNLEWRVLLPAALTGIGVALLVSARHGGNGGLVVVGIVMSVMVLAQIATPPSGALGGIGDRYERPDSLAEVEDPYRLGVGSLTLDLRHIEPDANQAPEITANVGIGELIVQIPAAATVDVRASAAIGETDIAGRRRGGVGVRAADTLGSGTPDMTLELSTGIGEVTVTR